MQDVLMLIWWIMLDLLWHMEYIHGAVTILSSIIEIVFCLGIAFKTGSLESVPTKD